jgi:hypothetical protein
MLWILRFVPSLNLKRLGMLSQSAGIGNSHRHGCAHYLGRSIFCLNSESVDLRSLKESLLELLEFLAGEGRTSANGWAVDRFFAESEGW